MFRSGFFLFLGLLLGRILGLIRELVIAGGVGANTTADIVIALITLPDILINILLGNALAAVFVPVIKKLPRSQRLNYFYKLSGKVGFIILGLVALSWWKIDLLAHLILPSAATNADFQQQLMWIVGAVPLIALSAVSRVFLQVEGKFTLLGLENVIFNVILIFGILAFSQNLTFSLISFSVLLGSALRWALQAGQVWMIYQQDNKLQAPDVPWIHLKQYGLAITTGVLIQLLPVYGRSITSFYVQDGALATYNYAYKFIELPMALGISVISTILFPKLSELAVSKKTIDHHFLIKESQQFIIALCLPASCLLPLGLYLLKNLQIPLKNISHEILTLILGAVAIGFCAFLIRGLNELYVTILNSLDDVKSPLYSTVTASLLGGISISFLTSEYGIFGAFWGLNISYASNWILNIFFLKRKNINVVTGLYSNKNIRMLGYTIIAALTTLISQNLFSTLVATITLGVLLGTLYLWLLVDVIKNRKRGTLPT